MLSKVASSTFFFFQVFGMTQPGIEPQSSGPLANTMLIRPMAQLLMNKKQKFHWIDFLTFRFYRFIKYVIFCLKINFQNEHPSFRSLTSLFYFFFFFFLLLFSLFFPTPQFFFLSIEADDKPLMHSIIPSSLFIFTFFPGWGCILLHANALVKVLNLSVLSQPKQWVNSKAEWDL